MKKLLGISLAAVLAVSPLMARADDPDPSEPSTPAVTGTNPTAATTSSEPYLGKEIATADRTATASAAYVKGAYNAAIGAINAEHSATAIALAGKQATLTAGNGIDIDANNEISADLATNGGLAVDSNNKLEVFTTGSDTIEKNSSTGALQVKAGSIGTTQLSSGVNATLTAAATKEGVSASIDNATASGNISASFSGGSVTGTLTSDASGLEIGGGTITNTIDTTNKTATVSVPTAWSGSVDLMEDWGDTSATTLGVTVSKTGTDATTTVLTGVAVSSSLSGASVTAATKDAITYTLTGLSTSGTATQTGATFDVHSTGYYDNASDNSPEYVPAGS